MVHNQDHPRGLWKIARVQSLITGRDGLVRGAVLRVAFKSGPPTILQRPLQLLYPLEIISNPPTVVTESEEALHNQVRSSKAPAQEDKQPTRSRPQREAAVRGRRLVKWWCAAGNVDHSLVVNWGEDVGD